MRILLSTILLTTFLSTTVFPSAQAQAFLPGHNLSPFALGFSPFPAPGFFPPLAPASTDPTHQWQLRPYASLQAGYAFFHGGISYLSVPAGVALFHPLNKNFSAFAGISAAPVAFSIARLYTEPAANGSGSFSRPYGLSLNAGVQAGLIYTNDAKTFSISGSVGLERGSYPVYPSTRTNTKHQ
jgi:hypothetical protein